MNEPLVEFHQHAGKLDISRTVILNTPFGFLVMIKIPLGAGVKPPAVGSSAYAMPGFAIVVLVPSGELHPVAIFCRIDGVCESVAGVSAESCHVQTVLVGLRSHRKRRIFDRLPRSVDSIDLTKNLSLVKAKFHYAIWFEAGR